MHIAIGTSGYAYKEWKGTFYPADLKADAFLRYYASQFHTVEINNTFYRMPKESVLLGWAEQVPADFTFCLKLSQKITHYGRLNQVQEEMAYFLKTATVLGPRLGPTLIQLPPNFKKDLPRLTDFLTLLPRGWRAAFEFRHASWFEDEVYSALKGHNCALGAADEDDETRPFAATADWGYLRLRREAYTADDLTGWAARVTSQAWQDAFVFFKHEDAGTGPRLAKAFEGLV